MEEYRRQQGQKLNTKGWNPGHKAGGAKGKGKGGNGKGLNAVDNGGQDQWDAAEEYDQEGLTWGTTGTAPEVMALSMVPAIKFAGQPSLNQV